MARFEVIPQQGGLFAVYDNKNKRRIAAHMNHADAKAVVSSLLDLDLDRTLVDLRKTLR